MLSARELHAHGLAESRAGRYRRARGLFLRGLDREPEPDTTARLKASLAHVESELGAAERGLTLCREALGEQPLSAGVEGLVWSQLGLLHARAGNGNEALAAFARALPLFESGSESVGTLLLNRGLVHLQRGDAGPAADDFAAAAELFRGLGSAIHVAKAEHNLGCAKMLQGDLAGALALMDAARPTLAVLSPAFRAVGEQDRAEVLLAAGLTTDAEASLEDAAAAYGARRLRQRQGEAELVLARTLLPEDPEAARRVARRAQRRFARRGSRVWALRAEAVVFAGEVEQGRAAPDSVRRAATLSRELRSAGLQNDATAVDLRVVRGELQRGEVDRAVSGLRKVRIGPSAPLAVRLLDREVRSEAAVATKNPARAATHVRAGLADLHNWQATFGSIDLQGSLVGLGRRLAIQGLRLALADGRPEVVFEWSERARALATRVEPVRPPANPDTVADLAELRQLHARLSAAEDSDRRDPAAVRRAAVLEARVRERAWRDPGSGQVTAPVSLDVLSAELHRADAALMASLMIDDRLYGLVATPDRAEVVDLGPFAGVRKILAGMQADLDVAASDLAEPLLDSVLGGLRDRLASLAEVLVAPLLPLVGDRRVVLTPAGPLAGTPWSLLPGLAGRPLTLPRAASLWLGKRAQPAPMRTAGLVAGPGVARAEEEVWKAASSWSAAEVVVGSGARVPAVRGLAGRVDVLHIAAHGRHSADNPLFSGVVLADGPLFGYDIDQVPTVPTTVLLSACELGRSSTRWGQETLSMAFAWLHSGARCVIAAPAAVSDDVACDVLAETHRGLASGVAPADALASAVTEVTMRRPSPFMCFGAGW